MTEPMTDSLRYEIVVNAEAQYSIWPADRRLPAGWTATGESGGREECIARIDELWTDMRPLSVRRDVGST